MMSRPFILDIGQQALKCLAVMVVAEVAMHRILMARMSLRGVHLSWMLLLLLLRRLLLLLLLLLSLMELLVGGVGSRGDGRRLGAFVWAGRVFEFEEVFHLLVEVPHHFVVLAGLRCVRLTLVQMPVLVTEISPLRGGLLPYGKVQSCFVRICIAYDSIGWL